jgi:hypothetical protein
MEMANWEMVKWEGGHRPECPYNFPWMPFSPLNEVSHELFTEVYKQIVPCVHITTRYKSQFSDFAQVHQLIHVS